MSNLQTYYHFKQDLKKVDQHDVIVDGLVTLGPLIRYAIFDLLCAFRNEESYFDIFCQNHFETFV